MTSDKPLQVEGAPLKPYRVYRLGLNDQRIELLADYDSEQEARAHKKRLDWHYGIWHGSERLS